MKLVRVEELKENQILARPVLMNDYTVLLGEGTKMRDVYIDKLKELDIAFVYVEEDPSERREERAILREETERDVHDKVKGALEHHLYNNNTGLSVLSKTADEIITEILNEEEVLDRVLEIKQRSADLYEHSINVCALSTIVSLREGFNRVSVHDIGVSALLHDLGLRYLTVPYENSDIFSLSENEIQEYTKHPIYAYTVLKDEKWISERSKTVILQHHEHLDGSGYPLRASNLLPETQVLTICDTFDEMICGIGWKQMKVYEAVEYLRVYKGVCFNARYVDTFLHFTAVYPSGSRVRLSDGRCGTVLRQNSQFPERPVLNIVEENENMTVVSVSEVDLIDYPSLVIEEVLGE